MATLGAVFSADPQPLRCEGCDARWFSRLAEFLAASPDLGRCVLCGSRLRTEAVGDDLGDADESAA